MKFKLLNKEPEWKERGRQRKKKERRGEGRRGDVTYCGDGHGHGLKNTGSEELAMIALILKK